LRFRFAAPKGCATRPLRKPRAPLYEMAAEMTTMKNGENKP